MAKKTTKPTEKGKSKIWDERLPKGVQHTIYAPSIFFELWVGSDSPLKKLVNAYLVEQYGEPEAPKPAAKAVKPDFAVVGDDDI